jgi:5-methylcytosine-specific restriction endonuclease McrA
MSPVEWVLVGSLTAVALVLLLREPFGRWRVRRREREHQRKREDRRLRRQARAERHGERAMNPARAAARSGPPRWQQVADRQGGKCWLCGTRTYADDRRRTGPGTEQLGATYPTVDYVVPIDQGGTYEPQNVRLAHRHCRDVRAANSGRREFGSPPRTFPPSRAG